MVNPNNLTKRLKRVTMRADEANMRVGRVLLGLQKGLPLSTIRSAIKKPSKPARPVK